MSTIDIRDMAVSKTTRIRFANDTCGRACFIANYDGEICYEDEDEDNNSYAVEIEDIDNFIKARDYARSLGWKV